MLRRFGYVLLIAVLAVVGVAMGAHGSTPAGHSTVASSSVAASAMPAEHNHADTVAPHSDSIAPPSQDAPCADCASDHAALLMACVFLALTVVVSLVLPLVALRFGVVAPGVSTFNSTPRGLVDSRPPELSELCINRQ
jgi:hypothetical protein